MRNRVLAVLAAVVLVVGAVVVRGLLDDDDDGTEVVTDSTTATAPSGTVLCIEELAVACAGIEGATVEAAGDTIERLSADENAEPPSAWVTFAPLQGALDEARRVRGLSGLFVAAERVATTPLVLVARADRGVVLEAKCVDVTWKCLGDNASASWEDLGGDARWGQPKVGHEAPDQSAQGAIVFGWVVASYFGGAAVALDDDGFLTWLNQLEQAVPDASLTGRTPLEQMVSTVGSLDVVGATAVEATDLITRAGGSRAEQFTIYPSEVASAEVVIAMTGGAVPGELTESLRDALTAAGWDAADGESTGIVDGLPDPGVVEALRTRIWQEVK